MGNTLSDDGISKERINEIRQITQEHAYGMNDPIWNEVFTMRGYLQHLSQSYLKSVCSEWSTAMKTNTIQTHNFEVFIIQMSLVVTVVPRRLLKNVSNDEYLDAVTKATNALFLTRCFLNTFMKECKDEEILQVFNVPQVNTTVVTPSNYQRTTLIHTYGETAFVLIETIVDVIVSHSAQQATNKLYMEAMGILVTIFSRLLRQNNTSFSASTASPYFSSYFLIDLFYICSGMQLVAGRETIKGDELPRWSSSLILSLLLRMTEKDVDQLDKNLYAVSSSSPLLLYPFQLFAILTGSASPLPSLLSPSASRCELLLSLLLCVNCSTTNPFSQALSQLINARYSDMQIEEGEESFVISFESIYSLICSTLEEPPVCILFYHMIHKVPAFINFIAAKMEYAFLPRLTKILYRHSAVSDNQIYLLITILLAFSQDASITNGFFSLTIRKAEYPFLADCKEDIQRSVGSVLISILISIITEHIHNINDFYMLSSTMAVLCNLLQQAKELDKFVSRRLVELLLYLSRRYLVLKTQLESVPDDALINITSELFSFYLDSLATFLTSDKPSQNVLLVYELLRQYHSVKTICKHPEFSHITTMIMMVMDYLNEKLSISILDGNTIMNDYNIVLKMLSEEVKSWNFIYRRGSAKYTFEDADSAEFFLQYTWDLLLVYCEDLDFSILCSSDS